MKKSIFTISLLLFSIMSIAQIDYTKGIWDIFEEDFVNYIPSTGVLDSRNGFHLSPHGQIRFLMVFVELSYSDTLYDPSLNGTPEWPVGQLPVWKDDLLENNIPNGLSNCTITKYFQLASSNNLIVLGDYLVAPNNGGVFRIPTDTTGQFSINATIDIIDQQLGNSFTTAHGFSSISDFDTWSTTHIGETKINIGNNYWDFVVFIIRNSRNPKNGEGAAAATGYTLLGHGIDAHTGICTMRHIPTQIIRHEFAHEILGNNNFHSGGGGWGFSNGDYWIPQSGGWGLLGLYQCSLWTWNAWDRYRLGWMGANNQFEISARDQYGIAEVNGDLDATNPDHAGIYTLRDFVTTGDALRIKLPFVDEDTEYPEWIWVENHQGYDNNGCEFDRWQYDSDSFPCVQGMTAGLMLYTQINNERRIANSSNELFTQDFYANYTRPLLANGHWDMLIPAEYIHNNCINNDTVRPFVRYLENPLTGANDQDYYAIDLNGNDSINKKDQLPIWTEIIPNDTLYQNLFGLGHTDHVFTMQGTHKIGMGTNPTTATQINMVGEDEPYSQAKNLRITYLNGISIEMIEQCSNGDIRVKIRFDDVDIDNDVRWCSPNIKLNKINEDGFSLNLKKNKTITLDRGLNATKMDTPSLFNGQNVFTSPTLFTVMPEVKMHIDTSANLILENSSTFHLSDDAACVMEDNGTIEVKSGTIFRMDDCSLLEINGKGQLIVRSGAELRISPNAILAFQNGTQNLIMENGVHIIPHFENPLTLINSTISNVQISGTETWNGWDKKVNGFITVQSGATLNIESSTLRFLNRNSGVIVQPGGKLIVDNSTLTNLSTNCIDWWSGIQVWGNSSLSQYPDRQGNYLQGYLELKNGATIENAVCAVELWKPEDITTTGGIIIADSAFFINNAKAVHALAYSNISPYNGYEMGYLASFDRCTFAINSDYLGTETFYKHVELAQVKGIQFNGCSFSSDPNVTGVSPWCSAIAAYDAGFSVNGLCDRYCNGQNIAPCPDQCLVHSTFSGFYDAIHAQHNVATIQPFTVRDAVFSGNDLGIYAINTGYPNIHDNTFYIGRILECAYGVYVENLVNFVIEENDFYRSSHYSGDTYGIGVFGSPAANDVYLNSFNWLTCGNLSVGLNIVQTQGFSSTIQGLTYTCNQNSLNGIDFCVLKDNGYGDINPQQGSSASPAGNTFSGSVYHFYNDGNNGVDYYYQSGATSQTPNSSLTTGVTTHAVNAMKRCYSHNHGDLRMSPQEEKAELEKQYQMAQANFELFVSLFNELLESGGNEEELAELRTQIAYYANERSRAACGIVRINLNDTVTNPQELRTWLRNAGDIASDRLTVASFAQEGDFDSALELAGQLPSVYGLTDEDLADHADYMSLLVLFKTLHDSGRTTAQLTEEEIRMVEGIAANTYGVARLYAKVLLDGQLGDRGARHLCPTLPQEDDKERGSSGIGEYQNSDFMVTVSPNPAYTQVQVAYTLPKASTSASLSLVNVLGEKVTEVWLENNHGSAVIDLSNLPAGLYFVSVTDTNGRRCVKKVVKQ